MASTMPPALFVLIIVATRSCFFCRLAWTTVLFYASCHSWWW
jgi:hypothetical protein